jgi:hypothetical protein
MDGSEPLRPEPVGRRADAQEQRKVVQSQLLAIGTLACPDCDAPVAPGDDPLAPADPLRCPVCLHGAAVRDFLSLTAPSRPARVAVRLVVPPLRAPALARP